MKQLFILLFFLSFLTSFAQQVTVQEWDEKSKTDIRLLPRYGDTKKTEEQKEIDQEFINEVMKNDQFKGSKKLASDYMVSLGSKYIYNGDLKTAMYRFNQAYLLDPENSNIYWGYGAVFMSVGNLEKAKEQYDIGLALNPNNVSILNDYATYYLSKSSTLDDKSTEKEYLDTAIKYLIKSYQINPKEENTLYKLSVSYFKNNDCENARKYYNECKRAGGNLITDQYTKDLLSACKNFK